jgi:hypothetical protein
VAAGHSTARSNGGTGIEVSGTVSHSTVSENVDSGIFVSIGTVSHNTALNNRGFGLQLGNTAGYTANVMSSNSMGSVTGGVSLGGGNHNLCNGTPC